MRMAQRIFGRNGNVVHPEIKESLRKIKEACKDINYFMIGASKLELAYMIMTIFRMVESYIETGGMFDSINADLLKE